MTSLVKKLEQAVSDNSSQKAWVVLLAEDQEKAEKELKALADKEKIKKVILAVEAPAGPPKYNIAKDADVTVLLYEKKKVKKNMAYEKGKLTEKEADAIAAAVKETFKKDSDK